MTLGKLLERVHKMYETTYPDEMLAEWAAEMDGRILKEDYLRQEFEISYDPEQDKDTNLLLQEPWTRLYDDYLLQQVHFYRGEYDDAQNFEARWNTEHKSWLKNLLMTRPADVFGRPWLTDIAFVRRGSDGVVHMKMLFQLEDIADLNVHVLQGGEEKITIPAEDDRLVAADEWLSVNLTKEDTAMLRVGSARLLIEVDTVAGERYESDAVQIRVLDSGLRGAEA